MGQIIHAENAQRVIILDCIPAFISILQSRDYALFVSHSHPNGNVFLMAATGFYAEDIGHEFTTNVSLVNDPVKSCAPASVLSQTAWILLSTGDFLRADPVSNTCTSNRLAP